MKFSKKQIIEKALKDPDVSKCIEAIVRTEPRSEYREVVVDAFEFIFCQVVAKLFQENLDCKYLGKKFITKGRIPFVGKDELLNTTGMNNKILTILCNSKNFRFNIGIENEDYLTIMEFEPEEKRNFVSFAIYFAGEKEIDDIIIKIIDSFRKN